MWLIDAAGSDRERPFRTLAQTTGKVAEELLDVVAGELVQAGDLDVIAGQPEQQTTDRVPRESDAVRAVDIGFQS
jgi:hypothetical protein